MKAENLIHRYLHGEASDEETAELDQLLAKSPELRKTFVFEAGNDAALREIALERKAEPATSDSKIISPIFRPLAWLSAAAALVLLAALTWTQASQPKVIAQLASAEDAAWESALPTEPGSELTRGSMRLTSGIATIRFRSGAEMMLEAPSRVFLKGPMRAKLVTGAAVMNVPESAIGFALETPQGHVVDHGTSFAVNVADEGNQTNVEVIEGEVSVHLQSTGEEVHLFDQQGATIANQTLSTYEGPAINTAEGQAADMVRVGTQGRSLSVIRANRVKWLHPDKLMVKRKNQPSNHERRAFFSFDLGDVDLDAATSVQLRLNQVPSGIGYASRLPEISQIAVYGLTNTAKVNWTMDSTWENGPDAGDGVLLGHLEIPRSMQRGSRFFSNEALLEFLRKQGNGPVTFILDGEIDPVTGERVPSLVHAFASDTHPEAAGPILEFRMKQEK